LGPRPGIATLIQIVAVPVAVAAPRIAAGISIMTVAWCLIPLRSPRYLSGQEPVREEKEEV